MGLAEGERELCLVLLREGDGGARSGDACGLVAQARLREIRGAQPHERGGEVSHLVGREVLDGLLRRGLAPHVVDLLEAEAALARLDSHGFDVFHIHVGDDAIAEHLELLVEHVADGAPHAEHDVLALGAHHRVARFGQAHIDVERDLVLGLGFDANGVLRVDLQPLVVFLARCCGARDLEARELVEHAFDVGGVSLGRQGLCDHPSIALFGQDDDFLVRLRDLDLGDVLLLDGWQLLRGRFECRCGLMRA